MADVNTPVHSAHLGTFGSPRKFPFRALTSHSAHLGSFRSVHLPVIRLTSEVSVPCTRHEVGYSSEVCRMHAGQAADTSDLPIQSRP